MLRILNAMNVPDERKKRTMEYPRRQSIILRIFPFLGQFAKLYCELLECL